ncbi:MAG: hemolysin [Bacteroidetes bacterium]|nr:MAG: hemolysin [Bacteroidota bacterium]
MNNWIIVLVTLLFSALFSGLEIAFASSNKLKIELDKNKGLFSAKVLATFVKTPSRLLGTLLLGNNVSLVIYGFSMAKILEPLIIDFFGPNVREFTVLITQTIISTIIILITAEFIPKILFRINPNNTLNFFAIPIKLFYWMLYPFIYFMIASSEFILKNIFRIKLNTQEYSFSPVDLDNYLKEFSPVNDDKNEPPQEIQMFQNAIDFRSIKLRECMVPRTELATLEESGSLKELKEMFSNSGFSKILIFKNSIDNIIGFVHSSDLFKKPKSIASITRTIPIVHETMFANDVLTMFINEHKSIALVVDEFGGTSGMVTMEDIIEEIFGEIEDEFDIEENVEKQINENEYLFSARLEIDYINEKYKLGLPEGDDYETLGGLIIKIHESIPVINDQIRQSPFIFIITGATQTHVEQVKLILEER